MHDLNESELSDLFDSQGMTFVNAEGYTDSIAAKESFNNWLDSLHKNGEVQDYQVECFCYVGRYAH